MIVLRTPKGWTGPKEVDGKPSEGTLRSHQVPFGDMQPAANTCSCSRTGCRATGRRSCSTTAGGCAPRSPRWRRKGERRMSANPHANGGAAAARPATARLPRLRGERAAARRGHGEATRVLGEFMRDVIDAQPRTNFRVFGPDETASNRWGAVFEVTDRCSTAQIVARRRACRARRPRDGDAQRAPVPGLARGLPADRPARLLLLLRGLHPHRRLDVQPARQVAQGLAARSRGGGRSPR